MKRVLGYLLLVVFVSGMACLGYHLVYLLVEPEQITQTIAEEVILRDEISVVIKLGHLPQLRPLRQFSSEKELVEFMEQYVKVYDIAVEDGLIVGTRYDCEDAAQALQIRALEQGFLMSVQLVMDGEIFGVRVSKFTGPHMGCLTIIGNDIYYVEPITDEICVVCHCD